MYRCVIVVSADRLLGIKYPLYVRAEWDWYVFPGIVGGIVLLTRLFSFYQHFEYSCKVRAFCYGAQLISICFPVTSERFIFLIDICITRKKKKKILFSFGNKPNPYSIRLRKFIAASKIVHAVVMVIIPIITLIILNTLLLWALRKRKNGILNGELQKTRSTRDAQIHYAKTEQRVTLTVALIVTAFTITNGPSAMMQFIKWKDPRYPTLICNTLVIFGKAINFILFCLSSKHFRRRLIEMLGRDVSKQISKFSSMGIDSGIPRYSSRISRKKRYSGSTLLRK
ncbi:unnamed protein product [Enterobius vermicularis]|uniref:G-protein coupled receptors family 1 profile domain-containing protein n=1 Tax=Enterobius vermicularis TaxID=51028 RepID=A0A3P6HZ52_ENTVE|nr:unnamed protein product [Enterobius vermicularis]